jgi:hypothetical protein
MAACRGRPQWVGSGLRNIFEFLRLAMLQRGTTSSSNTFAPTQRGDQSDVATTTVFIRFGKTTYLRVWARNTTIVPSPVYSARWAKPRKSS